MACNDKISGGLLKSCEAPASGIRKAWIANFEDVASYVVDPTSHKITTINMAPASPVPVFYAYEFNKFTGVAAAEVTKDIKIGSQGYTQTITLQFIFVSQELADATHALLSNTAGILFEDMNGQYWTAGELNGMDVTTMPTAFGVDQNEFNGITVTWTGYERNNFREIENLAVITAVI